MCIAGVMICYPSPPYCLSYISRSSPDIKSNSSAAPFLHSSAFRGLRLSFGGALRTGSLFNVNAQRTNNGAPKESHFQVMAASCARCPFRWWEKGAERNMKQIHSAHEFIDSLANAGDRLEVACFYSPWCEACRALHPKVCQLAASNPRVEFLLVNFEDNRALCYGLHIPVLPYFQFYRGAQGLRYSFTCTAATIQKLKHALAMHSADR